MGKIKVGYKILKLGCKKKRIGQVKEIERRAALQDQ
jgi:hypothetical protein